MDLEHVRRESRRIEFKAQVDFSSHRGCCEIIKDIVAIANSGGGYILVGVHDDGQPSGFDITSVMAFDPAKLTDKIASFTGEHYSDFEFTRLLRDGHEIAVITLQPVHNPMAFEKEGVYPIGSGQKVAFAKGTVYFRHGAKSEPATTADLRHVIDREFDRRSKTLLGNVRKVVAAPPGSTVHVIAPKRRGQSMPDTVPIRLVNDPNAPVFRQIDIDAIYPYRQTELLETVNQRLAGIYHVNTYDLQCARRAYDIDKQPKYFHIPKFGTPRYSVDFVDWLVERYREDPEFFVKARAAYKSPSIPEFTSGEAV